MLARQCVSVNEKDGRGIMRLQAAEVVKVDEFRYSGKTVQVNGYCGREMNMRAGRVE